MSAIDDLNKLLKNSKFIPQEKKDEYERLTTAKEKPIVDADVDKLKKIFGMKP